MLAEEPRARAVPRSAWAATVTSAYISRTDAAGHLVREDRGHAPCAVRGLRVRFRRVVRLDLTPTEAMCSAFETTRRACRDYPKPVSFDRCFEVAALLDAVWGVSEQQLELLQCASCSSHYLVSKAEPHPIGCPFCMLIRRHRTLLPAIAA